MAIINNIIVIVDSEFFLLIYFSYFLKYNTNSYNSEINLKYYIILYKKTIQIDYS